MNSELREKEMYTALGNVVIKCADFFTVTVQPICIEDTLVYALSQYGSEKVIIVGDDDYPDMELPEWCASDLLPVAFRKAVALSEIIHADIVNEYNIDESLSENQKRYLPELLPEHAYLKSIGQPIPIRDIIENKIQKIKDNQFLSILLKIVLTALAFAVGGGLLASYKDIEPPSNRGYICGGALLGAFYAFIDLFRSNYIDKE